MTAHRHNSHQRVKNLLPASKCLAGVAWNLFNPRNDTRSPAQPEPERGREPGIRLRPCTGQRDAVRKPAGATISLTSELIALSVDARHDHSAAATVDLLLAGKSPERFVARYQQLPRLYDR